MGTTAQKLQAIANSKAAIKAAIEAKGVSDVGNVLSQYATKIGQISGGGSSGDPRYEVNGQGQLAKKNFAVNYFNDVTSITDNCLTSAYYNSNVTSVSFPNLTSVGNRGLNSAFYQCTSLTSVDLSKVTSVGQYGLSSAFRECTSLTSVDLSSLTTADGRDGLSCAFQGCTSLTTVDLSSLTQAYGFNVLMNIFTGCTSLTTVDLSSLTSVENYGLNYAFYGCTSLTTVDLSSLTSVENYGLSIAFQGCTSLRNVYLTKLSLVGGPNGAAATFQGCTNLELVDFSQATAVPAISANTFNNTNSTFKIVVPDALYDNWIVATNWSARADQIVKASEYTPST